MTKKISEKAKISTRIFSGIFFLGGLAILVIVGISLGKEAYRKKQIQKEIEGLQSQISSLNRENSEMEDLISYLSSREFQEKEAREKLNLQKENEKMIVLKKDISRQDELDKNTNSIPTFEEDKSPNWRKWWGYFFGN